MFYRALKTRWDSGFFELVVARALQILGAEITVEAEKSDGKRIDFSARFPDVTVAVEAVSPVINASVGEVLRDRNPLLDIIESNAPTGWRLLVRELPEIGPADSKKQFRQTVKRLLSIPAPSDSVSELELSAELPMGSIRLHLFPGDAGHTPIWMEPAVAIYDNTEQRIRHAYSKKRDQVRRAGVPVLLAINAAGISSSIEDFDKALIGHSVAVYGLDLTLQQTRYDADGVLMKNTNRQSAPTFAGVLAFLGVGFRPCADPVLYLNPRFKGNLPAALAALERRALDAEIGAVASVAGQIAGCLEGLGFVRDV